MSTNGNGNILDRIAKLLALAGNNPEQHEAEAAAAKAAEMMARHNITMAQVAAAQAGSDVAKSVTADAVVIEFDSAQQWRIDLAGAVARSMQGNVVYAQNRGSRVKRVRDTDPNSKWYGRMVNTKEPNPYFKLGTLTFFAPAGSGEAMVTLYRYLEFQLPGLLNRAFKKRVRDAEELAARLGPDVKPQKPHGRTFRSSYMLGMVSGLESIFREMNARLAAEENTGSALVLLRDAVQSKMAEMYPSLTTRKVKRSVSDGRAYGQGVADSRSVDLGQQKVRAGVRGHLGA